MQYPAWPHTRVPSCITITLLHLYFTAAAGGPLAAVPAFTGIEVAAAQYPPGFTGGSPPATPPASPASSPAPPPGAVTIAITAFPAVGALTPISGVVSGLADPTAFEAVLYVRSGDGVHWWIKPQPGTFAALDATGAFTFAGWASNPPTDVSVTAFALAIIPIGTAIIPSPRE